MRPEAGVRGRMSDYCKSIFFAGHAVVGWVSSGQFFDIRRRALRYGGHVAPFGPTQGRRRTPLRGILNVGAPRQMGRIKRTILPNEPTVLLVKTGIYVVGWQKVTQRKREVFRWVRFGKRTHREGVFGAY